MRWLIYGANGYTGELIAREAKARGLSPILAGRSAVKLAPLAEALGLEHRAFALDDAAALAAGLEGVGLVLHCAGPFSATSAPMVEACLMAKAHYLDITGEIQVFEAAYAQHERAQAAGVVLCPGVGFDVVPTDCVALALKEALPDATHLVLGFASASGLSAGTAKTSVQGLGEGGWAREGGQLRRVPLAHETRVVDFGRGPKWCMAIPWGDLASAHRSTGIPNVAVFLPASPLVVLGAQLLRPFQGLLARPEVQGFLQGWAGKTQGPDEAARAKHGTSVWGEATNAVGQKRVARLATPNGYDLTVTAALGVAQALLAGGLPPGAHTPATLLGARFVEGLPGCGPIRIEGA